MKRILYSLGVVALLAFAACGAATQTEETTTIDTINGKEYASAYICPMHCEGSGADAPGLCPACEMDYVQNPRNVVAQPSKDSLGTQTDSTEAHHDHAGHTH